MFGFFSSRSRSETAAALHAKILDGTSIMWNPADNLGPRPWFARYVHPVGRLNTSDRLPETKAGKHFADVKFVAPSAFYQPKPRPSLTGILNWQGQTEQCSPQSNPVSIPRRISVPVAALHFFCAHPSRRLQNATRKGIIEKILLVAGRRRTEIDDPNTAPACPPATQHLANPPHWAPRPQMAGVPAPRLGLGLDIAPPVARTISSGYFIGRDGTEWPLPPMECMPKPSLPLIAPPRARPAPAPLGGGKWTAPIAALDTVEDKDAPFFAVLHSNHGMASRSTVATSLPGTPEDEVILRPVRNAEVDGAPRWGVIGDGRPSSKPELACPPTPFLGYTLDLPSPPFVGAEDVDDEDGKELDIGYWSESESESESGSEYSEFEEGEDDAWSISSVCGSDSGFVEDDCRSDFFLASDGSASSFPPAGLAVAVGAIW
uniref:Vacuolating cytotoxin autotransporter [Cleaved into: Vacuolating cytotoxin, Vacuolating cytotoxin translocator] n=1 Tax=Ganoderma boninense TaxID=34458 RepID=A0A5K1JVI3_9APHY|nr:Vacuolating cytotoxin autotransporter [Cleaved into: Vacuolating cytotoxin, Vacuolating cytotoxin translocator] [Ganoderma boninense]